MRTFRFARLARPALALCTLGSLFAAPAAHACQSTLTPWGLKVSNCNLGDLFAGRFEAVVQIDPDVRPLQLRLPNLVVSDLDNRLRTDIEVDVEAEVRNLGAVGSAATSLAAFTTIHDPLNNGASIATYPLSPIPIPSLAAGAGVARYIGTIPLPNRNQDWDVCSVATVDPALAGGSAWGKQWESDETDNVRTDCCRVFGQKSASTPLPSC